MFSVTFADHSEAVLEKLNRKLTAAVTAAAVTLKYGYRKELLYNEAPPHSAPGTIPHAYFGHKPGGFGPVFAEDGSINNRPESGFDRIQEDYLAKYIEGGGGGLFGTIEGWVGFRPSHVGNRSQNYLLKLDRKRNPWVRKIFDMKRETMKTEAQKAFKEAK